MVSIKEFIELREAGYTVDQIKEYSSYLEAPEKQPEPEPEKQPEPEQKKEKTPEQIIADALDARKPADPSPDQVKEIKDTLAMLVGAVRGMNINQLAMPDSPERTEHDILAEIINPPGKGETK